MRKAPLTCESKKVCIVIRKNKEIPTSVLKEYCSTYFERYAFIEHKGDIDPETGVVIGVHYHIVGDFKDSRVAFSTRLNTIVKFFKFDNANGIEIDKYITFEGAFQYLTHKNNPEKTSHKPEEIVSNLSDSDFNIFYNAEIGNVITFDLIFTTCLNSHNIIEVVKDLGIGNYRVYRNVIWDIWKTLKESEDYLK